MTLTGSKEKKISKKGKPKIRTPGKVEHLLQLKEDEIVRHKKAIENYPPERLEKYGKPFLLKLEKERDALLFELALKT